MDKLVSPVAAPTPMQLTKVAGLVVTTGVATREDRPVKAIVCVTASAAPNLQI